MSIPQVSEASVGNKVFDLKLPPPQLSKVVGSQTDKSPAVTSEQDKKEPSTQTQEEFGYIVTNQR